MSYPYENYRSPTYRLSQKMHSKRRNITYPVGFSTGGGKDSVDPVVVDVEISEHEGTIIHHHGVDFDQFVLVLLDVPSGTGTLWLPGRPRLIGQTEGIHQGLDTAALPTAWGTGYYHSYNRAWGKLFMSWV